MRIEGMIDIAVEFAGEEIRVTEIPYELDIETDSGVHTLNNGDPGVPPSSSLTATIMIDDSALLEAVLTAYEEHTGSKLAHRPPGSVRAEAARIREKITKAIEERGY